jgi:hypothetical protein
MTSYAADAKKIHRKPSSVTLDVPKECLTENKSVSNPEKAGDDCAAVADRLHAKLIEQIKAKQISRKDAQEVFDYEVFIRQVSHAYYVRAAEMVATDVGVRQ